MPTYASPVIPSLCSRGLAPLLVTGLLVQWLRQHFQSVSNLVNPELTLTNTEFTWSSAKTSPLQIESTASWNPDNTEKRPAILVKRGTWTKQRLGINEQMIPSPVGYSTHGTLWLGEHLVMILSGAEAEAELLATEVWDELDEFAPVVRRSFDFKRFEVRQLGTYQQLEEARKNYGISIQVGYGIEKHWRIDPAAPLLKTLNLTVATPPVS